jgi:hypothetical protein
MSNNKETPVRWLMEEITYDNGYGERFCSFIECVGLSEYFNKALQMESQKQQKYDEMINVLERVVKHELTPIVMRNQTKELIKEAKEL